MSKDNGGPAFPETKTRKHYVTDIEVHSAGGMSLRDYFAAKAMQAIISNDAAVARINSASKEFGDAGKDAVSLAAYSIADSMIKIRDK